MKRRLPTPEMARPAPGAQSNSTFAQRLGVFLLGIAIGFVILGAIQLGRNRSRPPTPPVPAPNALPTPAAPASSPAPAP